MFCEKCGTKIPDGQTQCPNCQGNPGQVQQPVYYAQPAANGGNFQLNMPGSQPAKPAKKKSEGVNLLLIGGVVLALLAVILVAVFSGVFASPEDQLVKMEKTNAALISKVTAQTYGTYLDALDETLEKLEKGYGTQTDITLSMDNSTLTGLLTGLTGEDMSSVDLSWLNSVLIRLDADAKGTELALQCGIGLNDTVLASLDVLTDLAGGDLHVGVPELSDQYLHMDLEQMGVTVDVVQIAVDQLRTLVDELPAEKDVQKMLDSYLQIVFSYVEDVEKSKETVTVGDQTKELTVLNAKITERKLMELVVELARTAMDDETLKALINAVENYQNGINSKLYTAMGYDYGNTTAELYPQLQEALSSAIEELEAQMENAGEDNGNYILLSNYVSSGMIVGRKIDVYSSGESMGEDIHYMYLPGSNGGRFEAVAPDLKLEGIISGDNMDLDLIVEGGHVLTLRTQELQFKDGVLTGKLRLVPGETLIDELTYSMGMAASVFTDSYIQLGFDGDKSSGTTEVKLVLGGNTLATVAVSAKEDKFEEITVPSNAISVSSDSELMTWVAGIKFDQLIQNLQSAGVPSQYVQLVQQLEVMLQMQGMLS